MLSTENPPSDPPCLNTRKCTDIRSDEKTSDDNNNQLEVVDLSESGLDDDNSPVPKFSIRDYVFSTRSKDIQINWPFSLKILQLCLKHGVKDVLPPFQSLDSVRNPSVLNSAVENTSNSNVKLADLTHHISSSQELAADIGNTNSSSSEEAKELPSTTTSQFGSGTNSVPPVKSPFSEPQPENLTRSSSRNFEFPVPAVNKVQRNIQTSLKKGRLIVKLNNIAEPKSNQDSTLISSVVSEMMVSKVCPVCKTFSSTSNTTLNAHIDQCLSGKSTVDWTTSPKVVKHRIKPRKTRSMVEVYETALHCTLEDLDRRNGTNWASSSSYQAHQQSEEGRAAEKGKSKMHYSGGTEDNEEGTVYIDSNGTKLRILSKSSDLPSSSNAKDDCGHRKIVKRDAGNKSLSSKKTKHLARGNELVKDAPCGQQSCPPKPDLCSKVVNVGGNHFTVDGDTNEDQTQFLKGCYDHKKSGDLGMIKKWVCSKRTGLKKKFNIVHDRHQSDQTVDNLRTMRNSSLKGNTFIRGTTGSNSRVSDDDSYFSRESRKRNEKMSCDSDNECIELTGTRKRAGFSSLASQECRAKENGLFSKYNVDQSRKSDPSFDKCFVEPPCDAENLVHSSIEKVSINMSPVLNTDGSFISSLSGPHALSSGSKVASPQKKPISSGGKKFSSLRNNLLSVRHGLAHESQKKSGRKHLDFKKQCLRKKSESDRHEVLINREDKMVDTPPALMEKDSCNSSIDRTRVLRIRKKGRGFVTCAEGDMGLKGSAYLESTNHGVGTPDAFGAAKESDIQREFPCEPISDGDAFIAFSKSLDSTFPGFAGLSDVESHHYIEGYEGGDGPAELIFGGEQDMHCSDDNAKGFVIPSNDMEKLGGDEGRGNYFTDVDPILIPGPPGSFLPSPGRLGSEEHPGNSSLTSCKLHSSEDDENELEQLDMDSSYSPLSDASTVSNSVPAGSDSVSLVNLTVQTYDVLREISQRDISVERIDPVVETSIPFEQAEQKSDHDRIDPVVENSIPFEQAEQKSDHDESRAKMFHEANAPIFESGQSCCCSRKELGALQNGSSNYEDSKFLDRQSMASLHLHVEEKQTSSGGNSDLRIFTEDRVEKNEGDYETKYTPAPPSQNSEAMFPTCDFESPSLSNPVLRLMGKNLMVMKKDGNLSPQTRPTRPGAVDDYQGVLLHADSGVPTSNIQTEHLPFHHRFILDKKNDDIHAQLSDFTSSGGFQVPRDLRMPQCSRYPSTVALPSNRYGGNFTPSLNCHEYTGKTPDRLLSSRMGSLDAPITYDISKIRVPNHGPSDYSHGKPKEIIIIDDPPEHEAAGVSIMNPKQEAGGVSMGVVFGYDPMHVNSSCYGYQTRSYPLQNGSCVVQNTNNIHMSPSKGVVLTANPVKWEYNPQGSSTASSSLASTNHLRSPLYFSSGFPQPTSFT